MTVVRRLIVTAVLAVAALAPASASANYFLPSSFWFGVVPVPHSP